MEKTINTETAFNPKIKGETLTYDERLIAVGIKTIYPEGFKFSRHETRWNEILLEYQGKQIPRPKVSSVVAVVKREFGLIM